MSKKRMTKKLSVNKKIGIGAAIAGAATETILGQGTGHESEESMTDRIDAMSAVEQGSAAETHETAHRSAAGGHRVASVPPKSGATHDAQADPLQQIEADDVAISDEESVELRVDAPAEQEAHFRQIEADDEAIGDGESVRLRVDAPAEQEAHFRQIEADDMAISDTESVELKSNLHDTQAERLQQIEADDVAISDEESVELRVDAPAEQEAGFRQIEADDVAIGDDESVELRDKTQDAQAERLQQVEADDVAISDEESVELKIDAPSEQEAGFQQIEADDVAIGDDEAVQLNIDRIVEVSAKLDSIEANDVAIAEGEEIELIAQPLDINDAEDRIVMDADEEGVAISDVAEANHDEVSYLERGIVSDDDTDVEEHVVPEDISETIGGDAIHDFVEHQLDNLAEQYGVDESDFINDGNVDDFIV